MIELSTRDAEALCLVGAIHGRQAKEAGRRRIPAHDTAFQAGLVTVQAIAGETMTHGWQCPAVAAWLIAYDESDAPAPVEAAGITVHHLKSFNPANQ